MNAIQVNQDLRALLNVEDHKEFVQNAKRVLDVLTLTKGLWAELSYAYKAAEIAERVCEEARTWGWNTNHHGQKAILDGLMTEAAVLARDFRKIQSERTFGESNVELAS